jgi:DNA-directed RNA polymerase subunit RPC12/RpoP
MQNDWNSALPAFAVFSMVLINPIKEVEKMYGKEYGCKDCGRAFRVKEEGEPKCPSCESKNVTPEKKQPLPGWMRKVQAGSS